MKKQNKKSQNKISGRLEKLMQIAKESFPGCCIRYDVGNPGFFLYPDPNTKKEADYPMFVFSERDVVAVFDARYLDRADSLVDSLRESQGYRYKVVSTIN